MMPSVVICLSQSSNLCELLKKCTKRLTKLLFIVTKIEVKSDLDERTQCLGVTLIESRLLV